MKAGGSDLTKVVKVTIFISSMGHYSKMNQGYEMVFTDDVKPVRLVQLEIANQSNDVLIAIPLLLSVAHVLALIVSP